uniref:Reverse transcriptase domain-containing protein n=1 Tax=Photinus pyralis TaxID=7054 RepID=A0A1Y1ME70_PHOPY
MEDYRTVIKLLRKGSFAVSLDLKDAYYMIRVHSDHRKYLRFSFQGVLFEFKCLVFGLASAPYTFTKIIRPVTQVLRSKGIISVAYLDDFLLFGNSQSDCLKNLQFTLLLLDSLGFLLNTKKCCFLPKNFFSFLGFTFDSVNMTIGLPEEKRTKILKWVCFFKRLRKCKISKFAQFIGLLTSACPAIKYSWVYTKNFERTKHLALVSRNYNYNALMVLPSDLSLDFIWWQNNITVSCNPLNKDDFCLEICTDASLSGWGAYCKGDSAYGWWTSEFQNKHINLLELQAILFALQCFTVDLNNKNILIRTDNTTALACINRMGSVRFPHLNSVARLIWQWCERKSLWIFASYINSKDNWQADRASRLLTPDTEWCLNDNVFLTIVNQFGKPEIDLFASRDNHKCSRYISWFRDPGSEAVDAFTMNWTDLFFYAFPPFALILKVLQKIITDKAEGILIVPFWQSQPWYPLFTRLVVNEPLFFYPSSNLLFSPYSKAKHPLERSLTLVAARLSGKRSS